MPRLLDLLRYLDHPDRKNIWLNIDIKVRTFRCDFFFHSLIDIKSLTSLPIRLT